MAYVARIHPGVMRQIQGWGLSNGNLVDVYLQLRDEMTANPLTTLVRDPDGPGSLFVFELRDPNDSDFQQIFSFRVFFDEDEEHLNVLRGSYWRNYDPQ